MIQIYVPNKGNLQLADDASISLKLNNPIFADDNFIPGDYSFPFDLPGGDSSPKNANILEHPDIPDNHKNRFEIQDVELSLENNIFRKGTLLVDKANNTRYSANFRWGMKNIGDNFKNFKIRDLVDEQITITTETYDRQIVVTFGSGGSPYEIEINDKTFSNTSLSLLATDINNDPDFTAQYLNTGDTYGVTGNRIVISLTTGADDLNLEFHPSFLVDTTPPGGDITSNPFTDLYADFEAYLDSYYGATPPKDYIKYPVLWNLYDTIGPFSINEPTATSYNFGRLTGYPRRGSAIAPFMHLSHVFDKITDEFGVAFDGNFFDDPEYANALFYHCHAFHRDQMYIKNVEYRFYDTAINLRYCVPDITIETLLKGLQKKYNLSIVFKEDINTIRINRRKPVMLSKNYVDWTSIASNAKDITFQDTTNGYELQSAVDEQDERDSDDTYTYGDGTKIIFAEFGSIKSDETILGFTGPTVKQPMDGKFIPRLIFDKGKNTSGSIDYMEASYKGLEVTFAGTGALGESEWLDYLRFITNRKIVEFDLKLEFRHLNEIDWEKKIRIFGDDYLIKSISTSITNHRVEVSKAELYKI